MEWVKRVMIVFDSQYDPKMIGDHNGKFQAVELRLRSDGRMFYMGKHSKVLPMKVMDLMDQQREERWNEFLAEDAILPPCTEEEFFANAEHQREELEGAYL